MSNPQHRLIKIAAELVRGAGLTSNPDDLPRSTASSVRGMISKTEDRLRILGIELKNIADSLKEDTNE